MPQVLQEQVAGKRAHSIFSVVKQDYIASKAFALHSRHSILGSEQITC